jgi:alkyl hydroperoxide reductase subunit AhpF
MSENILDDDLSKQLADLFAGQLQHSVEIVYFSKQDSCEACDDAYHLLTEITNLSDKLFLRIFDMDENPKTAQQYNIQHAPGLLIAGREADGLLDYGIRFTGIPSGYEFNSLIQGIIYVSKRDSGLKPGIRNELRNINNPVNLKIFVTPT